MLLERDQALVGVVAAILIAVGTLFAVGLTAGAFTPGYPVRAEFTNAAGITAGDDVLVAGFRAGVVTDVRLEDGRILVELKTTAELPTDTSAAIVNENLLGARALELHAGSGWDELLEDAADPTIPLARTHVLVDVPELGDETVALLRDADTDALTRVITSLADVTEGRRDEVGRLLDGLSEVSAMVAQDRRSLTTLVDRGETVAATLATRDDDLVRIIDHFGATVARLSDRRDRLRTLLEDTGDTARLTADLVGDHREELDRILAELDAVVAIVDRHQVDLAHAVAYGGVAFSGFASVGRSGTVDNPDWANILTSGIGPAGIDAFAGCGGVLDQLLDQVLGPAECPQQDPAPQPDRPPALHAFFRIGGAS
jgi:phospholipid/cholesterol/gamma-HCH transport system substrate-binding protein